MAGRERLVILYIGDRQMVVARFSESGQFIPVERKDRLPVIPKNLQGDLRNVSARVAFELSQMKPDVYGEIDTSDHNLIAEGEWFDSLTKLLKAKGIGKKNLPEIIARGFGAANLDRNSKKQLLEDIASVLDRLVETSSKL
ncbi:MAG: hypothetical protein KatS3mg088_706 [Patescibacteria group bacterium]|nr:MAG: hypothetical protein KatS3mg088_706 [Patescibacteria group bacterium]